MYPNFSGKKNIKSQIVIKNTIPNINNTIILKPDTKIIVIHVSVNKNVWPKSGWLIKIEAIKSKIKKE